MMVMKAIRSNKPHNVLFEPPDPLLFPKLIGTLLGMCILVLLPYLHFGILYTFWNTDKEPVDREKCINQCWDTLFKGSYETKIGSGYKHIFFNITHQAYKIWSFSIVAAICFYETVKHLTQLVLTGEIRSSMLILLCTDIYPHYYGWWMYFNALNDDFYKQWYHQAFFSLTELSSTFVILYLCNRNHQIRPNLALVIIIIGLLHILVSSGDQFIANVILHKGAGFQYYRDIGFMLPDLLHIIIPGYELILYARHQKLPLVRLFSIFEALITVCSIVILLIIAHLL